MVRKQKAKGGKNVRLTFVLPGDHPYGPCSVVGDFNDWDPLANPFKKRSNGTYSTSVEVPKGQRYSFRYLGDNDRWFDETDEADHVEREGDNSVVHT